jgi:hypothetical protein
MVSAGVEMVFGSAAAISAAFGYTDRVGLDVELLEQTQQRVGEAGGGSGGSMYLCCMGVGMVWCGAYTAVDTDQM